MVPSQRVCVSPPKLKALLSSHAPFQSRVSPLWRARRSNGAWSAKHQCSCQLSIATLAAPGFTLVFLLRTRCRAREHRHALRRHQPSRRWRRANLARRSTMPHARSCCAPRSSLAGSTFARPHCLARAASARCVVCLETTKAFLCFAWRAPAAALMVAPQVFIAHVRNESRERVAIKLLGWRKEPAKARQLRCAAAALLHAAPASVAARCALLRNVQRSGRVHPRSRRASSCCTWPRPPSVTLTLCRSFRT